MPIATITNLEKHFGKRVIFQDLEFIIDRGERVGLIGPNGAGKSTLFKVLTGEITPDVGTVAVAKSVKVGHLVQDPKFDPANTVMDEAELAFAKLHQLAHQMRDLEHAMGEHTGDDLDKTMEKYTEVQGEFDLAGGYDWQHKLEATLLGRGPRPRDVGAERRHPQRRAAVPARAGQAADRRARRAAAGRADQPPGPGGH